MRLDCSLDDAAQLCPQFSELIQDHGGNKELWVKRLMRDLWTTMETNRHRPPRWGSATLGLAKLVVVRRQNSLFSGCIVQDRIEMTRMSWISTSLHTHPLSPLIRAGALGIANVIRLQAVGQARPSARGRARSPQDSEPRRVCPPDVLFENCHERHGYYRRKPFRISSTIVGSSSPATGAQNATRSCSSRDSR